VNKISIGAGDLFLLFFSQSNKQILLGSTIENTETETPLLFACFAIAVRHHGETHHYRSSKYFDDRSLSASSKSGLVIESSCKCCDAPPFLALTSTRKVAHICGIPGQGNRAGSRVRALK